MNHLLQHYHERAQAAYAAAEAAKDPRDAAAYKAAAQTWERLAKPTQGTTYSMEPHRLQLAALKRDAAAEVLANEPECGFSAEGFDEEVVSVLERQHATIEF